MLVVAVGLMVCGGVPTLADAASYPVAWGINDYGQLGTSGPFGNQSQVPLAVSTGAIPTGVTITQLTAGANYSLALGSDGKVYAWGDNAFGQLGDGSTTSSVAPVAVSAGAIPAGVTITQIAAGGQQSLAVGSDGKVYAWGYNGEGELGNNSTTDSSVPVAVSPGGIPTGVSITQVAAGHAHSMALGSDGKVYDWGYGDDGSLGYNIGSAQGSTVPGAVSAGAIPVGVSITQVSAGSDFSLALGSDGKAYAWGYGNDGQLGNDTPVDTNVGSGVPVAVSAGAIPPGVSITQLVAGASFSLALGSDDKLYAWGQDNAGQLGNNSTADVSVPVAVSPGAIPAGTTITRIAAGELQSYALGNGDVYAWGKNTYGELGNNSTVGSSAPVGVLLAPGTASTISEGSDAAHELALAQLVPTPTPTPTPTPSPTPPTGPVTKPVPVIHVGSVSGGKGTLSAKLSCPAKGSACEKASVRATVTEHFRGQRLVAVTAGKTKRRVRVKTKTVVIASASVSLKAGATRTLTLKLNAAGRALLDKYGKLTAIVTITSGGKTRRTITIHIRKDTKATHKK
jgi:alpha-tubulin suppressor-like RCC1 family protein